MYAPGPGPTAVGMAELVDLLESSRDLALILDVSGRIRWANAATRAFALIDGPDALAARPHHLSAFVAPANRDRILRVALPALAATGAWSGEVDGLRPDGTTAPLSVSVIAHRTDDGTIDSFSAIARDISAARAVAQTLGNSEQRMRTLVDAAPIGIFETNPFGSCTYVNPAFCRIAGVEDPDDALGLGWGSRVHPDDAVRVGTAWAVAVHTDQPFTEQFRFVSVTGEHVWADVEAIPVHDDAGRTTMFLGTIDDITERARLERERFESAELFRAAFDHAPNGMVLTDVSAEAPVMLRCNEQYSRIVGRTLEEMRGTNLLAITHPDDVEAVLAGRNDLIEGRVDRHDVEVRTLRPDGSWIWCSLTRSLVRDADGRPKYALSQVADITAEKAAQARIAQLAFTDPLTSLPNRRAFVAALDGLLSSSAGAGGLALLFIDLDHFKVVNDESGHEAGDELLVGVARVLRSVVRDGDLLARLGGDEFAVVLLGARRDEMVRIAERVAEALHFPRVLDDGQEVTVTASVGMAWAEPAESVDRLLRRADEAMYSAKRHGRARLVVARPLPH